MGKLWKVDTSTIIKISIKTQFNLVSSFQFHLVIGN